MSENVIEIKNLVKTYHLGNVAVPVLKGVDLTVRKNDYLVLKGPSGSGKSTLMHIIGCLDRPDGGSYLFEGRSVEDLSDNELAAIRGERVGFVFQTFNLIPRLTIMKNVELPLFYLGVSARERRLLAEKALTRVGLSHRLAHSPSELSGGEKQRVAIARAIITNPSIILADEPTGNLDSKTGAEILGIFDEIIRDGGAILLVTHDDKVARKGNRIVSILDGEIVEETSKNAAFLR